MIGGTPYNAASPLTTPTYDGSGQATHPSVVHVPGGWNGYAYWMAMTPYALGDDDLENPSILASHDNITWVVPTGLRNPIDRIVGTFYNADTELVLHDGTLHCLWRYWDTVNGYLKMRTTTDGIHWTPAVICDTGSGHNWTSPAIVVHDGTWHAWVEQNIGADHGIAHLTAPAVTGPWSAPTTCTMVHFPAGRNPWHLDVVRWSGYWWMAISDGDAQSTGSHGRLVLATSRDGVTWNSSEHVMAGSSGWDARIYRPTIVMEDGVARLWYGGEDQVASEAGVWHIGYTEIPLRRFPEPPA